MNKTQPNRVTDCIDSLDRLRIPVALVVGRHITGLSVPIHFLCSEIEQQLTLQLKNVQVDNKYIDSIRKYYLEEVADKLGRLRPDERAEIRTDVKTN
jgi:hypothetical protein